MAESSPAAPAPAAAPAAQPAAPNPAVRDILRQAGGPATTPVTPIGSAPSRATGGQPLSTHPDAVRARNRRAAARAAHAGQPVASPGARASFVRPRAGAGPQFTPGQLRDELSALPAPPPPPASPEQLEKAERNIAMIIRGAGWLASSIFKRDYMRVEDRDARDTAKAILDGYPELANESDADYRKIMAWAAVGGLALERYSRYQQEKTAPPAPRPTNLYTGEPAPEKVSHGIPMTPPDLPPVLAMMPVDR